MLYRSNMPATSVSASWTEPGPGSPPSSFLFRRILTITANRRLARARCPSRSCHRTTSSRSGDCGPDRWRLSDDLDRFRARPLGGVGRARRSRGFLVDVARRVGSFFAFAELNDTRFATARPRGFDGAWGGLPVDPQWATWYDAEYSTLVRPRLRGGEIQEFPEGLMHRWSTTPARADAIRRGSAPHGRHPISWARSTPHQAVPVGSHRRRSCRNRYESLPRERGPVLGEPSSTNARHRLIRDRNRASRASGRCVFRPVSRFRGLSEACR